MNTDRRRDVPRYIRFFRAIAQCRICDTRRIDLPHGMYILKRRLLPDRFITLANRVLGFPFEVLPTADWLSWETLLYSELHAMSVEAADDCGWAVLLPALPGEVAGELIAQREMDIDGMSPILIAAVYALKDLHSRSIRYPDGIVRPFSHGDATIWNVLYDHRDGEARWFDFETVHRCAMRDDERHADDLKALLFSAASLVDRCFWDRLNAVVLSAYSRPCVIEALSRSLQGEASPNRLRLMQVRMRKSTYRDFKETLWRQLEIVKSR